MDPFSCRNPFKKKRRFCKQMKSNRIYMYSFAAAFSEQRNNYTLSIYTTYLFFYKRGGPFNTKILVFSSYRNGPFKFENWDFSRERIL